MRENPAISEWRRAQESLGAVRHCHDGGFYADAVSQAYYAVLHAAKAALQLHEITATSHGGVKNLFGHNIVEARLVERRWGGEIEPLRVLRTFADYDVTAIFSVSDSRETCERAQAFLNRIRKSLAIFIPPENREAPRN